MPNAANPRVLVTLLHDDCDVRREPVDVHGDDVLLTLRTHGGHGYEFTCPRCRERVAKPAEDNIARLLVGHVPAQVIRRRGRLPETVLFRSERNQGVSGKT